MGIGGQRHAPVDLPPRKTRYPLYVWLGGPRGCSGRVRKISPPLTGIRSLDRPARSKTLNINSEKPNLSYVEKHLIKFYVKWPC
jgi:hypothetical protein